MASDKPDKSSQTEEPTEKKLQDAVRRGNTPNSREVGTFMTILATTVIAASVGPAAVEDISAAMVPLIDRPEDFVATTSIYELLNLVYELATRVGMALLPIFVTLVICGLVGAFAQGNVVIAPERIRPKLERISLFAGARRIFGLPALVEFGFGLTKLTTIGLVTAFVIWPTFASAESAVFIDVNRIPELMRELTLRMLFAVAGTMVLIVIADLLWRRFDWRRNLRMSTKEIKDELKQVEGDPLIKARIRELRRQRARKRMMEAVPKASVVIMNPTHYAVALKYERGQDAVPICVAKGLDLIALKIREVAEEHDVPVVEDPPLARALHASIDIDQPIKPEFYRAVAQIISYVLAQNAKREARTAPL